MLDLNILIRGQSNAAYFSGYHQDTALAQEVGALLGFDGRTARVTLLGGWGTTEQAGTALIWDRPDGQAWMRRRPEGGWAANRLEQRLLDYLAALPGPLRTAPTLTLWMHNETDSSNPDVTRPLWRSAIQAEAGWVRATLGQAPATTPYMFAWVPFDIGAGPLWLAREDQHAQDMRLAMADLVADQSFHAVSAPQTGDLDMNGAGGPLGGMHISLTDAKTLTHRLALAIACAFRPYARPGAPMTVRSCDAIRPGPLAAAAQHNEDGVTVQIDLSPGTHLSPLGQAASAGAGWAARLPDGRLLQATRAQLTQAGTIRIDFAARLPPASTLHYGYGHGRISAPDGTGAGAGIYDSEGRPMVAPAEGLKL